MSRATLEHYEQAAQSFWEGTKHHDVSQDVEAFLRHIRATPPFAILDLGCGPGARYGSNLSWLRWQETLTQRGFMELEHYFHPEGRPLDEQPWLASVWRKSGALSLAGTGGGTETGAAASGLDRPVRSF